MHAISRPSSILAPVAIGLLVAAGVAGCGFSAAPASPPLLASPAFSDGQSIPREFTCDGRNVSPPLSVSAVPGGARSLALIVDDPDAPSGAWIHWTMWNIDPGTARIESGAAPTGAVEGKTSSGKQGYDGPCPPTGAHHYRFQLFALGDSLHLTSATDAIALRKAMSGHILSQAVLTGTYSRK